MRGSGKAQKLVDAVRADQLSMETRNVFEGWERQCFGHFYDEGACCAAGWLAPRFRKYYMTRIVTEVRLRIREVHGVANEVEANDNLRLTPDQFRALNVCVPVEWFREWK